MDGDLGDVSGTKPDACIVKACEIPSPSAETTLDSICGAGLSVGTCKEVGKRGLIPDCLRGVLLPPGVVDDMVPEFERERDDASDSGVADPSSNDCECEVFILAFSAASL